MTLAPIQASALNAPPRYLKSTTELARQAASKLDWLFDTETGSIHDPQGKLTSPSIEALADAAEKLGWFHDKNAGINWGRVGLNHPDAATERIRGVIGL